MQTPGQQMNNALSQNSISALVARLRARSTGAPLPFTSQGPVENSESGRGPAGCMKDSPNFLHVAWVLGGLFLIERVRCISESAIWKIIKIFGSEFWIHPRCLHIYHYICFYLKMATFFLDWCVAGYTLGREYPTMGHGDMFSGIVTPLALSLTFCIMIGKTLAKWLQVHVFHSEPCNFVLAFWKSYAPYFCTAPLRLRNQVPWPAVVVLRVNHKLCCCLCWQ